MSARSPREHIHLLSIAKAMRAKTRARRFQRTTPRDLCIVYSHALSRIKYPRTPRARPTATVVTLSRAVAMGCGSSAPVAEGVARGPLTLTREDSRAFERVRARYAKITNPPQTTAMGAMGAVAPDVSALRALCASLGEVDIERAVKVFATSMKEAGNAASGELEPVKAEKKTARGSEDARRWRELGAAAIRENKLAVVLLAGGQGTRLGSDKPKGMYNIGLPSNKSLFELQGERLRKLGALARGAAPVWYVMTSPFTHDVTVEYFKSKSFFGLDEKDVFFFKQGTLPCFTEAGEIILSSLKDVAQAPDGNGGIYAAMAREGVIKDMKRRGIEHVYVYCVDNALVQVGDPAFVGRCIESGCEAGAKVIPKAYPTEPVGVFATRKNPLTGKKEVHVVEYSEIPEEMATEKDKRTGELRFNAANIALHYFSFNFLSKCCLEIELPHHVARKKIPYVDLTTGLTVKPTEPNGIKLEAFIFDVYRFAESVCFVQGDRAEDFAPVKNAEGAGKDSPDTARDLITKLHARWIADAGGCVAKAKKGDKTPRCEVAPSVSYAGEGIPRGAKLAHLAHVAELADFELGVQ